MKHAQTCRHKEQTCGCQGEDELGVCYQQMQTSMYRVDKQQSPTVQLRNYIPSPEINLNGKEH